MPLLAIENLSVSYSVRTGAVSAVSDVSLNLEAGESVGLVGESGCGKSTIAMAIMRYLGRNGRVTSGRIRFRDRDLLTLPRRQLRRVRGGEIAMVYQEPTAALNPTLTIESQLVEVPMLHGGHGRQAARRMTTDMLADVRLADPDRVMRAYPHQLSGGEQQRVLIAMALLGEPALLLLDEPTASLDATVQAGIVALTAALARKFGTAMLYISHNLGLIRETCDRAAVMYAGEIVEEGSVEELFFAPRHPYTQGLFDCIPTPAIELARPIRPIEGQLPSALERLPGCAFAPRCSHARAGLCDRAPVPLERHDASHAIRCVRHDEIVWSRPNHPPEEAAFVGRPFGRMVRVEGLRKHFPLRDLSLGALATRAAPRMVRAVEDLSFTVAANETAAIVGESGCGKSTFARVLMGLEVATDGEISVAEVELGSTPAGRRDPTQLRALQMVFQDPHDTLNPSLSVGHNIGRAVRKLNDGHASAAIRERVAELLALVRLPEDLASRKPHQLSGGQKQRVSIARAFAGSPSVVVADEPVSALDVSVQAAVIELLIDMQRTHGTALIFISHDLGVVRTIADRVVVMYLGRVMEKGGTVEVFAPPYHPYTEALISAAPLADPESRKRHIVLEGTVPSALDPPRGCPFHTRCPRKLGPICEETLPPEQPVVEGHVIACHIPLEELARVEPVIALGRRDPAHDPSRAS